MKYYLVSGGAGYVGSAICKKLIEKDKHVICIDNLSSGKKDNIKKLLTNPKFTFIKLDISKFINKNKLAQRIKVPKEKFKIDCIINAACRYNIQDNNSNNEIYNSLTLGINNLLKLQKESNCKFMEISCIPVERPYEKNKGNLYTYAHLLANTYLENNVAKEKLDIINLGLTYGPGMGNLTKIGTMILNGLQGLDITLYPLDTKEEVSILYIEDAVEYIVLLSEQKEDKVYHLVANPELTTFQLIANHIKIALRLRPNIVFSNKNFVNNIITPSKKQILEEYADKFIPNTNFEEGIRRTIEYFYLTNHYL